ncbi:hypothetical protein ACFY0B_44270 [Streptomyces sp. NPDC001797]|uniref:Uncharacterized protein n=1 Tax=Streptomyces sp. 900105755 TaxID=3154389 RepID=A0ABV1TU92_9ACTN
MAWRGAGPVLAGVAIRRLSPDCAAVVCEPGSADGRELTDDQSSEAAVKLECVWERGGFEPFRDDRYVMDRYLNGPRTSWLWR